MQTNSLWIILLSSSVAAALLTSVMNVWIAVLNRNSQQELEKFKKRQEFDSQRFQKISILRELFIGLPYSFDVDFDDTAIELKILEHQKQFINDRINRYQDFQSFFDRDKFYFDDDLIDKFENLFFKVRNTHAVYLLSEKTSNDSKTTHNTQLIFFNLDMVIRDHFDEQLQRILNSTFK